MFDIKAFYSNRDRKNDPSPGSVVIPSADLESLKFTRLVFAPDPDTGNPVSDVRYMLSGTDEGFKQYVKEKLFRAGAPTVLADDPDQALAVVKPNAMTEDQYLSFMNEYVRSQMIQQNEDD